LGELISAVLDNCVSDGALMDKTSPWLGKLGEKVADSSFTLSSAPFDSRIVWGEKVTGDGYISADYDIIKDGVLKSFALSRYGAKKTGFDRAANTARNIVIAGGDTSLEELYKKVGRGLCLNRFSGGSPSPNGDFSGVAKNSFLIEDGKLTDAVSETMVSGNLLEMLGNIIGISRETAADGGTVLPWILFGGVTISGK
jgi:PmbA protein